MEAGISRPAGTVPEVLQNGEAEVAGRRAVVSSEASLLAIMPLVWAALLAMKSGGTGLETQTREFLPRFSALTNGQQQGKAQGCSGFSTMRML
jgi:hypothetical protein